MDISISPRSKAVQNRLTSPVKIVREGFPEIILDTRALADVECITTGIYSPLKGFLGKADYTRVIEEMRLQNGTVWPIPVTLPVSQEVADSIKDDVLLVQDDEVIGIMHVTEKYSPDKEKECANVYGTTDPAHPGVKAVMENGEVYLGGKIELFSEIKHDDFQKYRLTPAQTRTYFKEKGWKTVVAFQTRNPLHRAHEYLQKVALEMTDGLLISPLVGATKADDVPADVRIHTYEVIMDKYYPKERVLLGVFPAAMRYAGPREAIMHALARKNYGVTHFIVGRDHAGVGDYYGTYDAQKIFNQFTAEEIGITPLCFEHAFYCKACGHMGSDKTCPHGKEDRVHLSGTKVRAMLSNGEMPHGEFTRPEVAKVLIEAYQK